MAKLMIVDVRGPEEFNRERIRDSIDIPLSFIEGRRERVAKLLVGKEVLLMCRSGARATLAKQLLDEHMVDGKLTVYEGGILKYKEEHPDEIVTTQIGASLSIMRQVQIVAGGGIALFSFLALTVNINFSFGALLMGSGLLFAGLTGNCLLATLLGKLPFNK